MMRAAALNNVQFLLMIGIPTLAVLVGILINGMQFSNAMQQISGRFASPEARLTSVETRLDMLIAKMMDFDTRLTRLEERFERLR